MHCWWEYKLVQPLYSTEVPQKMEKKNKQTQKNTYYQVIQLFHSGYLS